MLDVRRHVSRGGRGVHDPDAEKLGQEIVGRSELERDLAIDRGRRHRLQLCGVVDVRVAAVGVDHEDLKRRSRADRRQPFVLHLGLLRAVKRNRRRLDADRIVEHLAGERILAL